MCDLLALFGRYDDEPKLRVAHPLIGPVDGATVISIFGSGFLASPYLWCKFVGAGRNTTAPHVVLVVARRVAPTFVQCVAPPFGDGYTTVQTSFNGADFSDATVVFEY